MKTMPTIALAALLLTPVAHADAGRSGVAPSLAPYQSQDTNALRRCRICATVTYNGQGGGYVENAGAGSLARAKAGLI